MKFSTLLLWACLQAALSLIATQCEEIGAKVAELQKLGPAVDLEHWEHLQKMSQEAWGWMSDIQKNAVADLWALKHGADQRPSTIYFPDRQQVEESRRLSCSLPNISVPEARSRIRQFFSERGVKLRDICEDEAR